MTLAKPRLNECLVERWHAHEAKFNLTVDQMRQKKAEQWMTGQKRTRSVNGINHPHIPTVSVLFAMFFAQNTVAGEMLARISAHFGLTSSL